MAGPLSNIRVLDLTRVLAGPWATQMLADFGAEVIKIEKPGEGDDTRGWGPPFLKNSDGSRGDAAYFLSANRGKTSVCIDMASAEGQKLIRALAAKSDVVIENFKVGGLKKYGLDYDSLITVNPKLIYCSISGYGQDGPSKDEAAMDLVVQASSGLLSITGTEEGEVTRCGYGVSDITAGMFAVIGILIALHALHSTGQGQYIDISMFDSMISAMCSNYSSFLGDHRIPTTMGTRYPTVVPYGVYETKDRPIAIAVGSEKLWTAFRLTLDLQDEPQFQSNALRIQNRAALDAILNESFQQKTAAEWIARLQTDGIPSSLVLNFQEVADHPQSRFRQMFPTLQHPTAGAHQVPGPPIKPAHVPTTPAPLLGQHTREVLADLLELDQPSLDRLEAHGIIFKTTGRSEML
jgi:crotonobetainyl-CoA:carnitine CoA-transferase CaiB-like acyl-CoA transferase